MFKKNHFILLLLIVGYLLLRLPNLTLLPIFADEAIYLHWSQIIWHDQTNRFIPLSDGKTPLFMWLTVPFLKIFSDPLVAGRMLSISAGLFTLIGIFLLTQKLFSSRKIAFLASLLVIFQPFLIFYDRIGLVDSMLTSFAVWSFYLGLILFNKPRVSLGIFLGTLWGGALLTKPSGAYIPLLTPMYLVLFPIKKWLGKIKKLLWPSFLALFYGFGFYNILRLSGAYHMISSRSADYLRSKSDLFYNPFQFIPGTSKVMFSWLLSYLSWWGIILFFLSLAWAIWKKEFKIALLSVWILAPFLIQAAIAKIIYPRYLLITVPFILIIIAWFISEFIKNNKNYLSKLFWLLPIIMMVIWLKFDLSLLTNPVKAPLHKLEKEQYLYEWSAGYGIKEIALFLKDKARAKPVVAATEGYFGTLPDGLQVYLDQAPNIEIFGVGQPIVSFNEKILQAVNDKREVYLIVNSTRLKFDGEGRLELIASYPKPLGPKGEEKLMLYRVK